MQLLGPAPGVQPGTGEGVPCGAYAAVLNGEAQDLFVGGSREAGLQDRNGVVPLRSQLKGMAVGKGFRPEKASLVCEDDLIGGKTGRIFEAGLDVLRPELRIGSKDDLSSHRQQAFRESNRREPWSL